MQLFRLEMLPNRIVAFEDSDRFLCDWDGEYDQLNLLNETEITVDVYSTNYN